MILGILFIGCAKEKEVTTVVPPESSAYVGSEACRVCHAEIFTAYIETGHHSALSAAGNIAPSYPDSVANPPANPPSGYTWNQISYVVGGFAWKANFVDADGFMVTGTGAQWNYDAQDWADYHSNVTPGTESFDCGQCHATGYDAAGNQGDLEGIDGTWAENGVGCEACHGAGAMHVENPRDNMMQINESSSLCGECHYRDANYRIEAENGLIKHNQQYSELKSARHGNILCVTCHNPHMSTAYDAGGLTADCSQCHDMTVNHAGPDDCVNCHMPYSVLSAESSGSGIHLRGDMRSHIFAINTDTGQGQFYPDGANMYSEGFNGLNFACLSSCHSSRDLAWAESNAGSIHP